MERTKTERKRGVQLSVFHIYSKYVLLNFNFLFFNELFNLKNSTSHTYIYLQVFKISAQFVSELQFPPASAGNQCKLTVNALEV